MTKKQIQKLNNDWVVLYNGGKYDFDMDEPDCVNLYKFFILLDFHADQMKENGFSMRDINEETKRRIETFSKKHPFK